MKTIFDKYMIIKDPKRAHAELSASGSERWMGCSGSIRLSQGIPSIESEAAQTGTHAHTLLQFILENYWGHHELLKSPQAKKFKKFIEYSDYQYQQVMVAVDYVLEQKSKMPGAELHVEKKVELKGVGFGTADVILYQFFGILHIIDYKNGMHKVEPKENSQGLYYACAAADLFGWDFSEVWITIIQPNAPHRHGPIRTWKTTPKRLLKATQMFKNGAERTRLKNAPLVLDSKWCWFCPARQVCPKQQSGRLEKLRKVFEK